MRTLGTISPTGPYDLALSLAAAASFAPDPATDPSVLRTAVRLGGQPVLLEVRQVESHPPLLEVACSSAQDADQLAKVAAWMLFADLNLRPFYSLLSGHAGLDAVARRLHGLKPMRPASLFEMAVVAVTEQQISLAAAYRIRARLIERFGDSVEGFPVFPPPARLARAPLAALADCGLSRRKAEYIGGLAKAVVAGSVELEQLKDLPDAQARAFITDWRGFGSWSADYILVRGLGRLDVVPADDLGIRTVVGAYLGDGSRMAPDEVSESLAAFAPYRGLAAFYLLADARLEG